MAEEKKKVRLANGDWAWLYTMSNGAQYLADVGYRRLAEYDPHYNRTTSDTKVIGKGNIIPTLLG